ncbi:glycosyltransferase [Oxalobacteraceae bacterium CAVE-383]|nr:glycosyltransferase [Oxalobacteraceae bacterium CAVE-383]
MNILNVNHLLDAETGGGTAERTFQLSRFFEKAGEHCTILTLNIGLSKVRVNRLPGTSIISLPCINLRYFVPILSFSSLKKIVKKATVVQLSGHWTVLNALVFLMCRYLKKPYVFCPAGALAPVGRSIFLKRVYDALFGFRIAKNAAMCIAITPRERADFARYGVAPERVTVIPNGIDPQQYESTENENKTAFREKHGLDDFPYILFLGRLNTIKGPDLLLEAFANVADRFPSMHMVFAGPDGGMLPSMKNTVAQHGLDKKVHFIGYIDGAEKIAALQSADLLTIPSRREAMSIVVLEAGICATPVLFTDACGLEEFARENVGTMTVVSVEGVAAGLEEVLSNPAATRDSAMRLRNIVLDRYTWEKQTALYVDLFKNLSTKGQH